MELDAFDFVAAVTKAHDDAGIGLGNAGIIYTLLAAYRRSDR